MNRKENTRFGDKCRGFLLKNLLVTLTMVGAAIGFVVGYFVESARPSGSALMWIGMPGELYIRMLKLMIVPLVVCSIITGTAAMDPKSNGKISAVSLLYIFTMNGIAPVMAVAISLLIKPGKGVDSGVDMGGFSDRVMETEDIFADLLRNIVPDNLAGACFRQTLTKYNYKTVSVHRSNGTFNWTEEVRQISNKYLGESGSTNILGLIVISAVFGIGSVTMKDKGEPFLNFFRSAMDITIRILGVLMWSTPVGVASLIAKTIAGTSDIGDTFRKLGMYFLTAMVSLLLWGLVLMPILYYYLRRKNPFRFLGTIVPSMLIVFATTSTVMALPESFHSLEEKNKIDSRITRFVAPIAATIGRPGSAIYISTSCIFIIQMMDTELNFVNVFLVILLTWISALAIPSVTGASLVTVLILLTALNIPAESAAMLFALEFFLDRVRSTVNLITQMVGVVATNRYVKLDGITSEDQSDNWCDGIDELPVVSPTIHLTGTRDGISAEHIEVTIPSESDKLCV